MKLEQMLDKSESEEILKIEKQFSLYNRRNQYPYDIITNPARLERPN